MKASDLTLEQKILQTMIVRITDHDFIPLKVGGVFFGGEAVFSHRRKYFSTNYR